MKLLNIWASKPTFPRRNLGKNESPRFRLGKGFTLIEILVVVGILALIISTGALIGFDAIGRGNIGSERDLLVTLLSGVRAQALANVNEKPHGIHFENTTFTLFEGTYVAGASTNRVINRNVAVTISPLPPDVIFAQLSGNVSGAPIAISLSQSGSLPQTIDINAEGRIEW